MKIFIGRGISILAAKACYLKACLKLPQALVSSPVINRSLFQVKGRESRSSYSKPPIDLSALRYVYVTRCVQQLPTDQLNWVRYAYTKNYTWDHEQGIALELWRRFIDELPEKYTGKPPKVMEGLAYLILQDFKHRCNTGKKLYSVKKLQTLLDAPVANWRRDYSPKIKLLRKILTDIDSSALVSVDSLIIEEAA